MLRTKRKRRSRRRRRDALVYAHLENVSRDLLERHPDIVRDFIGRNAGVYALYRRNRLYYVGLANALRHRLKAHVKNKHSHSWDSFSVYLTIKDQHLREIEALMLRLARPSGARQRGRLAQSKDLRRSITRAVRQKQNKEVSSLFVRLNLVKAVEERKPKKSYDSDLIRLLPEGARLMATYKGKVHRARVRRDGRVRFNGEYYPSLSLAAKSAARHSINGWWFWRVQKGKGNWVRLYKIRKAGTPVYSR
jgi:Restriction Enzyme Adenine Methylase Associated/Protein of unknown function (DUF2924)